MISRFPILNKGQIIPWTTKKVFGKASLIDASVEGWSNLGDAIRVTPPLDLVYAGTHFMGSHHSVEC